jgi:hypothetical protein
MFQGSEKSCTPSIALHCLSIEFSVYRRVLNFCKLHTNMTDTQGISYGCVAMQLPLSFQFLLSTIRHVSAMPEQMLNSQQPQVRGMLMLYIILDRLFLFIYFQLNHPPVTKLTSFLYIGRACAVSMLVPRAICPIQFTSASSNPNHITQCRSPRPQVLWAIIPR